MSDAAQPVRCSKQVRSDGMGWQSHQCHSAGKVMRDGKMFCGVHDPEVVKARQDKRNAKWDAERKAKQDRWAEDARKTVRADLCVAACKDLPDDIVKRMANFGRNAIEYFILGRI